MPEGQMSKEEEQLRAMEDPEFAEKLQEHKEQEAAAAAAAAQGTPPPAAPPAPPVAPAPPAAPAAPTDINATLDAIQKKVELGQDLTEEEQKKLDELDKAVPAPPPEIKYRIAGEEITYTDAAKKAREEIGIGAVDMSPEAELKLTETWVRAQNKSEQSKAAERRSQEAAHAQESVTDQEVVSAQRSVIEAQSEASRAEDDLKRGEASLKEITEEIQYQQSIAAKRPTQQEIDMGLDYKRQADLVRADDAAARIDRLTVKASQLQQTYAADQQRLEQAEGAVKAAQDKANFLEVSSFVVTKARELQPSMKLSEAVSRYTHKEDMPEEDWEKVHALMKILAESDLTGQPIARVYNSMKRSGQLTVRGAQSSNAGRSLPIPRSKDEELINRVNRIRERAQAAPARLPSGLRGSPAGPGGQKTPEQLAEEHIKSERIADPVSTVDKALWEGKILNQQRPVSG